MERQRVIRFISKMTGVAGEELQCMDVLQLQLMAMEIVASRR